MDEDATEDEDMEADQERRSRRRAEKARARDEEEDKTLGFAVFALRDVKEGEEVADLSVVWIHFVQCNRAGSVLELRKREGGIVLPV